MAASDIEGFVDALQLQWLSPRTVVTKHAGINYLRSLIVSDVVDDWKYTRSCK